MQPRAAHQPRPQRLGPGTTVLTPPRNRVRAPWGVVAAPSRLPSAGLPPQGGDPPPQVQGRCEPHGGVAGAGAGFAALGAGGGLSCVAARGRTLRPPPSSSPHKGADGNATLTGQSGLQAPASGRAARQGGSARECACICVCPGECLRVCVKETAPSSVRLRVRGRRSVCLSARRSVRLSVRAPPLDRPTNAPQLRSRRRSRRVGSAPPAQPGLRPASGRACAAPGNCAGPARRRAGGGEPPRRLGPSEAGSPAVNPWPGSPGTPLLDSARSPRRRRPRPRPRAEVA